MRSILAILPAAFALSGWAGSSVAQIPIPARPPSFGFLDVDQRERWFERTLQSYAARNELSSQSARMANEQLSKIREDESSRRQRHGHLSMSDRRAINIKLDALAYKLGWRTAKPTATPPRQPKQHL